MGEEGKVLEDHAQLPLVGRHVGHVLPVNKDPSLVGGIVAGDAAQGGRLAAARRPQQGHQFPAQDAQVDVVIGHDMAVAFGHVAKLDHVIRHGLFSRVHRFCTKSIIT